VRRKGMPRAVSNSGRVTPATGPGAGQRLRASLKSAQMSKAELARLLAGPAASTSRIETVRRNIIHWTKGTHAPSAPYARALANIFNTDEDYFAEPSSTHSNGSTSLEAAAAEFARQAINGAHPCIAAPMKRPAIRQVLPIRPELVLLTAVDELEPTEHVRAQAKIAEGAWGIGQVYPETKMVPSVLLIESIAQTGALGLVAKPEFRKMTVLLAAYGGVRFRRIVEYGEVLTIDLHFGRIMGFIAKATARAWVGDELAVEGDFVFALHS
jgi:3-hydroxyacyl-[acyl-carrier-protein] dehydratase